ncbi:MAG: 1-acyl-sn-glycerol-3-phosphate acyltransferase [archaeon]
MEAQAVIERGLTYQVIKYLVLIGDKLLSNIHVEGTGKLKELKRESDGRALFLYASTHTSLFETTAVPATLYREKLPVPYACMGDNLVKGEPWQRRVRKLGAFIMKRPETAGMRASRDSLVQGLEAHLEAGKDMLIFPEGSRTCIIRKGERGVFHPACFEQVQAFQRSHLTEASRGSIVGDPELYIVPVTVSYSKVKDAKDMLESVAKAKTLKPRDVLKVILKPVGHVYISFGEPIRVMDYLDTNRKELAGMTRQRCLELVKILPVNVVGEALMRETVECYDGGKINCDRVLFYITQVRNELGWQYPEKFRRFTPQSSPEEIFRKGRGEELVKDYERRTVMQALIEGRGLQGTQQSLAKLYASYIGHYMQKAMPATSS